MQRKDIKVAKKGRKKKTVVAPPEAVIDVTEEEFSNNLVEVVQIPQDLLDRCKKIGVSNDQIKQLGTVEAIKAFCDQISPETNPDSLPKKGEVKEVVREPEAIPEIVPVHKDKIREEKEAIESIVRGINIKFNTPVLTKITKVIEYDCETGQVIKAEYTIRKD